MLRILDQPVLAVDRISAEEFVELCNETQRRTSSKIQNPKTILKFYRSAPETAIWLGVAHHAFYDTVNIEQWRKGACSYKTNEFTEFSSNPREANNVFLIQGIHHSGRDNYVSFHREPRTTVQAALRAYKITQLTK